MSEGRRWGILIINFFACAMAYAGLTMWNYALEDISSTFSLTNVQVTLGSAFLMAGYAIGSVVEARLSGKIGYRGAGALGLILMVIGTFGIPLAHSYPLILVFRFLQGWGILWQVGVAVSIAVFPAEKRGMASGIVSAGITLGIGGGGWVANILIGITGGWQRAFGMWAWILLGLTIVYIIIVRVPKPGEMTCVGKSSPEADCLVDSENGTANVSMKIRINPLKTIGGWMCVAILFFDIWQGIGYNTVLQSFLKSEGYSGAQAATAILAAGLIGILSTILGGVMSDRLIVKGWEPLKARAFITAIPGFLAAAVATVLYPCLSGLGFPVVLIMSLALGWGIPVVNATSGALPMDILQDEEAAGNMFGVNIGVGIGLGGILVPIIASAVQTGLGWNACFLIIAAGAVAGMIIALLLPKFKLQDGKDSEPRR